MAAPAAVTPFSSPQIGCASLISFGDHSGTLFRTSASGCSSFDGPSATAAPGCQAGYVPNEVGPRPLMARADGGGAMAACCPSGFMVFSDGFVMNNGDPNYFCYGRLTNPMTIMSASSRGAFPTVLTTIDQVPVLIQAEPITMDESARLSAQSVASRTSNSMITSATFSTGTRSTSSSSSFSSSSSSSSSTSSSRSTSSSSRTSSSSSSTSPSGSNPTSTPSSAPASGGRGIPKRSIIIVSVLVGALALLFVIGAIILRSNPRKRFPWLYGLLKSPSQKYHHPSSGNDPPDTPPVAQVPYQAQSGQPAYYNPQTPHFSNVRDLEPGFVGGAAAGIGGTTTATNGNPPGIYVIPPLETIPALDVPSTRENHPSPLGSNLVTPDSAIGVGIGASVIGAGAGAASGRARSRSSAQRGHYDAIPEDDAEMEADLADVEIASEVSDMPDVENLGPAATDEDRLRMLDRIGQAQRSVRMSRESGVSPI